MMDNKQLDIQKKINSKIKEYQEHSTFADRVCDKEIIKDAERILTFALPEQYQWFLCEYGGGSLGSFEVLGLMSKINAVTETIKARKQGLPEGIIVIHNSDEWYDCIDVSTGNVVTWSRFDEDGILFAYEDFNHYVLDYLQDAIDNL